MKEPENTLVSDRREPLLSPADLAREFGIPIGSIYSWSSRGEGPQRFRVGRHLRYRREDVDAWLDERRVAEKEKPGT